MRLFTIVIFASGIGACGFAETSSLSGSGEGSGNGNGSDGRYRPPPNGVHISETEACELLHESFQNAALDLNCSKTIRPCPAFVQVQYEPDCMEYDQGSVMGCVEYFKQLGTCEELDPTTCIATAYSGTAPNGCP